jgi:hypothetical protein
VADEAAVLDHHGIDRSQPERVRGHFVQVLQDQLFAGMGDVQAVEAEAACAVQQLAYGLAGKAEFQQVDGTVQVAQALHVPFAFVHGRGE